MVAALAELGGVQPASGLVSRVEEGQFTPKTVGSILLLRSTGAGTTEI